jgi:hypothetical protein
MRLLLLQIAAFLLVPQLYAAERLLIMDVYVRIVPAGQIAPIPDPFIEAVVRGETPVMGEGIQALQGKSFQINPKFQDFAPLVAGVEGQKVSIQFTAAVLQSVLPVDQTCTPGACDPVLAGQAVPERHLGRLWMHCNHQTRIHEAPLKFRIRDSGTRPEMSVRACTVIRTNAKHEPLLPSATPHF